MYILCIYLLWGIVEITIILSSGCYKGLKCPSYVYYEGNLVNTTYSKSICCYDKNVCSMTYECYKVYNQYSHDKNNNNIGYFNNFGYISDYCYINVYDSANEDDAKTYVSDKTKISTYKYNKNNNVSNRCLASYEMKLVETAFWVGISFIVISVICILFTMSLCCYYNVKEYREHKIITDDVITSNEVNV